MDKIIQKLVDAILNNFNQDSKSDTKYQERTLISIFKDSHTQNVEKKSTLLEKCIKALKLNSYTYRIFKNNYFFLKIS